MKHQKQKGLSLGLVVYERIAFINKLRFFWVAKAILSFDRALSCPIVSELLSINASYNALIKTRASRACII